MPAVSRCMNGASRRLYLNHSAILGGLVIFTALSCDLNNPLHQDAGTSKDAGAAQDGGPTCPPLGGACQMCPNGYLSDDNGCATCKCKPPTTCGPVCDIFCAYGNVPDAQGCPTCACNPPPTGACSPSECGPGPAIASQLCPDGKTVAGPICLRDQTGACGWRITTCPTPPPTCVDTVLCIQGDHWDSTLCQCVPNPPPPGPCPCATGQLCVTQIGGPAISDPPPSQCEAPDPTCIQKVKMGGAAVSPCVCLAASDGTCTQSAAGGCTCDNGIR